MEFVRATKIRKAVKSTLLISIEVIAGL